MKNFFIFFYMLLFITITFSGTLKVHFIDVGQGDSILIESPKGKTMLIDAGTNTTGKNVVYYMKKQKLYSLDVVVGTHPHSDHIGGLDIVIDAFDIGKIFLSKAIDNSRSFEDLLDIISSKKLPVITAESGKIIELDPELKIEILAPIHTNHERMNDNSIVIKVTYDKVSFLLAADAEKEEEKELIDKKIDLKADVLKIGHHGSTTSTTQEFLDAVCPKYTVIMLAKNNDFKQPHPVTLNKLETIKAEVYRTDLNGNIVFETDGVSIKVFTERKVK